MTKVHIKPVVWFLSFKCIQTSSYPEISCLRYLCATALKIEGYWEIFRRFKAVKNLLTAKNCFRNTESGCVPTRITELQATLVFSLQLKAASPTFRAVRSLLCPSWQCCQILCYYLPQHFAQVLSHFCSQCSSENYFHFSACSEFNIIQLLRKENLKNF